MLMPGDRNMHRGPKHTEAPTHIILSKCSNLQEITNVTFLHLDLLIFRDEEKNN